MYEGPAGSADKGVPLQLSVDSKKLVSTSSFDIYRSAGQKEIIIYPTAYRTEQLRINATDLEKLLTGDFMPDVPQESKDKLPEKTQFYGETNNWRVYSAENKIIIEPKQYHPGQLVLSF